MVEWFDHGPTESKSLALAPPTAPCIRRDGADCTGEHERKKKQGVFGGGEGEREGWWLSAGAQKGKLRRQMN